MVPSPCRRARLNRGVTLFDLYRDTKIQPARLSLIERGLVEPRPDEVARIARVLKVDDPALLFPAPEAQPAGDAT